jgi:type I restriction enzyme S subunit
LITDSVAQQQALVFQIQNLRRTRDLLLPRLLSGQIDVETLAS